MKARISTNGHKGRTRAGETSAMYREVESILDGERQDILAGKRENAVLSQALAGDWSLDQLVKTARRKGQSWRFLSALADKGLELQGWALLDFMADAVGRDLAETSLRKALASLGRVDALYAEHSEKDAPSNPFVEQLFEEAREDLVDMTRETRQRYWRRVGRLMS